MNSALKAFLTANLASPCRRCLIVYERDSLRPALNTKDQGDCLMPNTIILNPNTGAPSFGLVPGMTSRGTVIVSGEIRLLRGKHLGPNHGFGACHIWAEHTKEMEKLGFLLESDVPKYVAHIIRTGTPLFYSGGSFTKIRLMAVRAVAGTAILEVREQRDLTFWSVVTAYSGTKNHGTRVGTVV